VHRTILVVDVHGFGDRRRTNPHQVEVRDGLYRALESAFRTAGIPWSACHREDRGDGIFVLAPAEVPKGLFVDSLPQALVEAIDAHNRVHPAEEQIRLRMALNAGEINYDEHGVTATAITVAFRLVNARALRLALAQSTSVLALIVSPWFFDEVVRNSTISDPAKYRPVRVTVKETRTRAWIHLPEHLPSTP
jgi:hypothetical protein